MTGRRVRFRHLEVCGPLFRRRRISAAAGKKTAGLIEKKLPKLIVLLLIVGAVFNRDLRGQAYTL